VGIEAQRFLQPVALPNANHLCKRRRTIFLWLGSRTCMRVFAVTSSQHRFRESDCIFIEIWHQKSLLEINLQLLVARHLLKEDKRHNQMTLSMKWL